MSSLGDKIRSSSADDEALRKLLSNASTEDIRSAVFTITKASDASSVLNSTLSALNAEAFRPKTLEVIRACVEALKSENIDAQCSRDVTGILLLQLSSLPPSSVSQLTSEFVAAIARGDSLSGRWLELFPKLLTMLAESAELEFEGETVPGREARARALAAVCRAEWSAPAATRLVEVLRDQQLAADELERLLAAAGRLLGRLQYQELPPLVYQLVRLCRGAAGGRLLHLLLGHFAAEEQRLDGAGDERSAASLRQAEGTVIYHVTHAPGLEQGLVREFVRHIRGVAHSPARLLTPFSLALALALAAGESHAQPVLDGLVAALARAAREEALRGESRWLREAAAPPADAERLLLAAAAHCGAGWAPAGDGLLRLALSLLAAGGTALPPLGARTLTALVGRRPEMARDAVARLVSSLAGGGADAEAHVQALAQLVAGCPLTVVESRACLTDLLAHLGLLPPVTARRLLAALLPLLKICVPLKDQLVLTLRKLLVSKRCEARQTAVCGLLLCLRHFRVASSLPFSQASQNFSCAMSQVAADVGAAFPTSANEALCLELLGVLRRCLGQQAAVRATLYTGLHEVISRNPELAESVLAMLLQQLRLYVETRDSAPPLALRRCLETAGDEPSLLEPLPELLACLAVCSRRLLAAAAGEETEDESPELLAAREAEQALDDVARRMMNVEPDDYDVGKEAEVGGASADGRRNALLLHLLQGVYQALLDHRCQMPFEDDVACAEVISCLFDKHSAVAELLRHKGPGRGKKDSDRGKAAAAGKRRPRDPAVEPLCLSLRSAARLLSALTADAAPGHQVALERLRGRPALVQHAADAAGRLCAQLLADGECAGAEGANVRHVMELACRLAPALLRLAAAGEGDELPAACLEALADLLEAFRRHFAERLPALLEATAERAAAGLLARCRLLLAAGSGPRATPPLLRLLLLAAAEAPDEQADLLSWSQQLLRQPPSDEPQLCRQLVELALTLADRYSPHSTLARQLARALHEALGDLDEEARLTGAEAALATVTELSGVGCLLALCQRLASWLDALDWLLAGCRAAAAALLGEAEAAREAAVCGRLLALVAVLDELVQTAVPLGPATDAVLRLLGRAYVSLAALVKYYAARSRHGKLTLHVMCSKFERLLEACGRSLTPHVYTFITFTEAQQRQQRQAKSADPAGKRARVLRQTRLIPVLICDVEQFEKHLIALAQRTKLDLHAGVKLSTSRDFRINQEALQVALDRAAGSEDEEDAEEPAAGPHAEPSSQPAPSQTSQAASRLSRPSQGVARLPRPSQRASKLSRPSQPAAKRLKTEKDM